MKTTYDIHPGMKVCVVGFGRSGFSILRYLVSEGADVLISDVRKLSDLSDREQNLLDSCAAEYEGGGHTIEFLGSADLIVVSPGIITGHGVLKQAADLGIPVIGELALAAEKFKVPVIAVTGTNGKTTVTELIGSLLSQAGLNVFVGGNIGTPISEYLIAPKGYEAVVLEVSSFQLELCGDFAPDVALLLNMTPDHLDRHGTFEKYAAAKMNLFNDKNRTTRAIINGDDAVTRKHLPSASVKSFETFGYDKGYTASIAGKTISLLSGGLRQLYDLEGCQLATMTGCLNSAAALLAVQQFRVTPESALKTMLSFELGDHRIKNIAEINGVAYIDDSKATNTGAVNSGLAQVGTNVILIAGGKEKGDDFSLLRECVQKYVKKLILIGEAAEKIDSALGDLVPVDYAEDMEEAVIQASLSAENGDKVLLSPACASFDMFNSYIHRGEVFKLAVGKMKKAAMSVGGNDGR